MRWLSLALLLNLLATGLATCAPAPLGRSWDRNTRPQIRHYLAVRSVRVDDGLWRGVWPIRFEDDGSWWWRGPVVAGRETAMGGQWWLSREGYLMLTGYRTQYVPPGEPVNLAPWPGIEERPTAVFLGLHRDGTIWGAMLGGNVTLRREMP